MNRYDGLDGHHARRVFGFVVSVVSILVIVASTAHAATLFDPALRFRTITTDHFIIYFHQHESATAARLASIAEETWHAIAGPLAITPPRRTHVVLADQVDYTNGYATPLPYNTIVLYAAWPAGSEFVGNIDDWLRVAFTHEFTHIVHLDRSGGYARWVHGIFGRTGLAFPNLFLPTWQIEGLATYEESALTGLGRIDAGDFTAILHEASRHGATEPLDRVNGGLTDWPAGFAAYAYGAGFHDYLAERFGAEALGDLANATARALPYTGSRAFKQVFGEPLGDLWREYASTLPTEPSLVEGKRITHHGFTVAGPRFDRASPREVWYSVSNADDFPALYRANLDTRETTRVVRRYLGSTSGVGTRVVYFDQQEWRRNTGLYSDLYALDRTTRDVTALTREARILDPDLSPDESTIVAVRDRADRRELVLVPARGAGQIRDSDVTVLASEDETQFNAPRWSPDGRQIAVERHRLGALSDVVVVNIGTYEVRPVGSMADARVVTPAWRPDGRAVVAAVAREHEPFNLVEFSIDGMGAPRQITHTTGGATWPDVAPDGSTIVFVGYTDTGFDVFEMAYPPVTSQLVTSQLVTSQLVGPVQPATSGLATSGLATSRLATSGLATVPTSRDYTPWRTLTPTSWFPLIATDGTQLRAGAVVNGIDVLGYHSYSASATWLVSGPAGAMRPSSAAPDWQVTYVYDRWRPSLFGAASSTTSFFAGPPTDAGTPVDTTRREQELEGGVIVPIRHTRTSQTLLLSAVRAVDEYALGGDSLQRNRSAIRTAWAGNTAQAYGYSISPEDGVTAGVTAELVRRALGSFADATIVTADARAYLPGLAPHHVVALRAAAGSSNGDATVGRTFLLGGSGADLGVASFSTSAISLLRGFPSNAFAGTRVAVVNADYRFPLARPQRGTGTWPIFLHTLHAAVFGDAGDAWSGAFRSGTIKTSIGAELSTSIVAGYVFPFTFAIGAAWGHDPSGVAASGATMYFRVGKAF
jgi:hypothetical protein